MADNNAKAEDLLVQAEETYKAAHPLASVANPVAPVTHGELKEILVSLLANGSSPSGGAAGLTKAQAETIAVKEIAAFANGQVFQDVVKSLIEAELTTIKAEIGVLVKAGQPAPVQKSDDTSAKKGR